MSFARFTPAFEEYLANMGARESRDQTHDYRRSIFLDFIRQAFDIEIAEVQIEERLRAAEVRGFIDALYKSVIFEFKKDLKKEREDGLEELGRYFGAQKEAALAFLTEGFNFEVYIPDKNEKFGVRLINAVDIRKFDPRDAYSFFDAYLFQEQNLVPTSADVVARFGIKSPTYARLSERFAEFWGRVEDDSEARVKYQEWDRLLAKVYGSSIGSEDLFLRHTYLSLLARCFAYAALFLEPDKQPDVEGLVTGRAFTNQGFANLAEGDFFAWTLHPEIRDEAIEAVRVLLGRLRVYDLARIDEDLLKELYQDLIDPADRHELGEYYTPDWLAEWTLREAGLPEALQSGAPSILDPSCGSGTFLFSAIRLARASGKSGEELVRYCLENVQGMDVHPLAVTISKVNVVLALGKDVLGWSGGSLRLPIYIADTIQETLGDEKDGYIKIPTEAPRERPDRKGTTQHSFTIPIEQARERATLERIIAAMSEASRRGGPETPIITAFWTQIERLGVPAKWKNDWTRNCRLLINLVRSNRDTIWGFILNNCFQPAFVAQNKVDFVVGNPPWLALNFIKNPEYQAQVKEWLFHYGLIERGESKLFTKTDLSTLFWEHCRQQFLKPNGTIALVMPRSVITGAKQHRHFRGRGFTKILEVGDVAQWNSKLGWRKVFNVPSCSLILRADAIQTTNIPARIAKGRLPGRNTHWDDAIARLTFSDASVSPPPTDFEGSVYYDDFKQGATISPRCMWFVKTQAMGRFGLVDRDKPALETDPDVDRDGKVPWKGQRVRGAVERQFLYATLLGDNLVPFGVRAFDLAILPIISNNQSCEVINCQTALNEAFSGLADWLVKSEQLWAQHKKESDNFTIYTRLNYQNTLSAQRPNHGFRVLYNQKGTNLVSCVLDVSQTLTAGGMETRGFIVDTALYFMHTDNEDEAHYLCAILNAPYVNESIKEFQTMGDFGPRDIHRRPFEVLPIPRFEADNAEHLALAELSRACHAKIAPLASEVKGSTARARGWVRDHLGSELGRLDELVRALLDAPAPVASASSTASLFAGEK